MTADTPNPGHDASPGYRVHVPRAEDAIGMALRDAYARDCGLPDDMVAMLRRLNEVSSYAS
jgi:hypothetical protein